MITYRELSSLTEDLGFSAKALYSVSNHIHRHYRRVTIPKAGGEFRELHVPDEFLKAIQRSIAARLLVHQPISPYATAYRFGAGTKKNGAAHVGKPMILKLDIRQFFDHIIYPLVKDKVFPAGQYSEQNRILLTMLCVYKDALPQGAPTSPTISNIILRDFDNTVGLWCAGRNIAFTRYCDDMTFSGDFDPRSVIQKVRCELGKLGLFLNDKKTTVVRDGQKKIVTGILVNEKLNVSGEYRRRLRQELYYCQKYGIASHMHRQSIQCSEEQFLRRLLGRINYVLQIDPQNSEMRGYKAWLTIHLRELGSASGEM